MIKLPAQFFPNVSLQAQANDVVHLFCRDAYINHSANPLALTFEQLGELQGSLLSLQSLGTVGGQKHFAAAIGEETAKTWLPPDWRSGGLRSWFGVLDDFNLALAMKAVQVLEWHRTHRFCGACGGNMEQSKLERAMRCPQCGFSAYPRIAPAMMALVWRKPASGQAELLLARGINFPPGRYSALAGFLEAGESIEDSIFREVKEEVGVEVADLEYFASQSWPFPNSLMIAFRAQWREGEIVCDPAEIADAQWFKLDQLPQLPPRLSIARALIEDTVRLLH